MRYGCLYHVGFMFDRVGFILLIGWLLLISLSEVLLFVLVVYWFLLIGFGVVEVLFQYLFSGVGSFG